MKILTKKCNECDIPYLWDCLGVVFKVMANHDVPPTDLEVMSKGLHPHSRDGQELLTQIALLTQDTNIPRENIIKNYIQLWVENVCSKIVQVLKGSSHWNMLGLGSQSDSDSEIQEEDFSLFKREVTTAGVKEQKYDLFPCYTNQMRLNHFIAPRHKAAGFATKATVTVEDFKSVMKENRFNKNHKDVMFVVCQILIWSMTCKDTQPRLTHLFSSTPTTLQYDLGSSEDAYRWMMNLFHSICDSISKSYQPWKTGFFVPHADHPIQCNPQQVIVLCLLGSAIEKCLDFYSFQGMRPVWPEELQNLRVVLTRILTKSRQEGGDAYPDMLTAISISHMLHMEYMPKNRNKAVVFRDRLKRSWPSNSNYTLHYNTSNRDSVLRENTIDGNTTADPRGSNGEKLIAIVSIRDIDNVTQTDEEEEEKKFTADIQQHYDLIRKENDNIFIQSLPDVSLEDDGNDDDNDDNNNDNDDDDDDDDDQNNGNHEAAVTDEKGEGGDGSIGGEEERDAEDDRRSQPDESIIEEGDGVGSIRLNDTSSNDDG
jgi:hypothetical protein